MFESCKVNKVCLITGFCRWFPFICVLIFAVACKQPTTSQRFVERGFYYWKSRLQVSTTETAALQQLQVKKLYVKFFDVEWNEEASSPQPVAKLSVDSASLQQLRQQQVQLIPVVFITNEALTKLDTAGSKVLATKITTLLTTMLQKQQLKQVPEFQLDCDWTVTTKENYFNLLRTVKKLMITDTNSFADTAVLSATIRLHQVKFSSKSGIPPVDRGLLMCYNMGNLKNPATNNSILEVDELKKYLGGLSGYPLQLDYALPVFHWYVLYRTAAYKGIVYAIQKEELNSSTGVWQQNQFTFQKDTVLKGISFQRQDQLRFEENTADELLQAADYILRQLPPQNQHFTVSFYHLDPLLLTKHPIHELETIYRSFNQ